ncbi:MAG: hypothetical protein AAF939_06495 [Planctomycetota bacterium]
MIPRSLNRAYRFFACVVGLTSFLFLYHDKAVAQSIPVQEIVPQNKFTGKNENLPLRKLAPESGFITRQEDWAAIWNSWNPAKQLPKIDFRRNLVIVETAGGPNNLFTNELKVKNGDLIYDVAATRASGDGFGFLFLVVPRRGIISVRGKLLEPSSIPSGQSTPSSSINRSLPLNNSIASSEPNQRYTPAISVEMIGKVTTGITAVGNETIGTVITSGGITWELDVQGNRQFEAILRNQPNLVRVTGQLNRVQGSDVADRMVLRVETLLPLSGSNPISRTEPRTRLPAELDISSENYLGGNVRDRIVDARIGRLNRRERAMDKKRETQAQFRRIKVTTTGGFAGANIATTVDSYGKVSRTSTRQPDESWQMDPENLTKLDQIVKQTQWNQIERVQRSDNMKDAFQYNVRIESGDSTFRFFLDDGVLASQKELRELIYLVVVKPKD